MLDRPGIGVIGVHRRIPDPDVEAVVGADPGHAGHHLQRRQRKMGAVGGVVGTGRDQLDGVGAEDGQLADVPLPLRQVPGVVRVGLGTIAKLMAAERILGRRGQVEPLRQRHLPGRHAQRAQQPPDAEEDASGIVADDRHDRRTAGAAVDRAECESLPSPCRQPAEGTCCRSSPGNESSKRAGPTAMTGTAPAGQRIMTSQPIRDRFCTSSTKSRTALFSGPESPSGTTTTARLKSISPAIALLEAPTPAGQDHPDHPSLGERLHPKHLHILI